MSAEAWPYKYFARAEMACRGSGECRMDPAFMARLERLRLVFGKPMPISSGYRSPAHNAAVSTTGETGPHTTGRAADILVRGADALTLIGLATDLGFTGIGVSQKGPSRFIHLDDLPDAPGQPRPTIWSY